MLNEHWDDGLPLPLDKFSPGQYSIISLAIYDPDNSEKINYLSTNLANSNYIVLNSRRLYGTLIHLNKKYPITSKYYKLLFSEKLGYKKITEFSSYPSLFGITINDDGSEETFQVYDHPKVIIFKNEGKFSNIRLGQLLEN
ncbi:MAG: glycosyl transferase family 39 [uncultured bacterium]|nr:MAG: glycosyl transferase family 39 [uncultured bacterium]